MACEVQYEELARYASGDCDDDRAQRIREHLTQCPECRRRLSALRRTDESLGSLPRLQTPASLLLRVTQALSGELRGGNAPEILTLDEVAAFLRVDVSDLDDVVSDLPAFELSGKVRVRREALLAWIGQREKLYARQRTESDVARILAGQL